MNTNEILKADINDIIFEGRNKEYGAYLLRNIYGKHLLRAAGVAAILFVLFIAMPMIAAKIRGLLPEEKEKLTEVNVELMQPPPIDESKPPPPPPPPPPPEPPPPVKPTVKFVPPKIVKDNEAPDEPPPPTVDELKEADPGKKTEEGNKSGVDMSQLEDKVKEPLPPPPAAKEDPLPPPPKEDNEIYNVAVIEQQPSFPDGEAAMYKYLGDNIKYPNMAKENGIEGKVYVQFVVEKDGSITDVKAVRGPEGGLKEEAVRVVSGMPRWKPGKQQGNAVRVRFTLPVNFKLQ